MISVNRLGCYACVCGGGDDDAAKTHTPCVAAIVILRCIEQYTLILISADLSQVLASLPYPASKQLQYLLNCINVV